MTTTKSLTTREPLHKSPLKSLRELEHLLGVPRADLLHLAEWEQHYAPFKQQKPAKPHSRKVGAVKTREIDNPREQLKRVQTRILKRLLIPVELPGFLYGAVPKRSVRDHAVAHQGAATVVKMDIKSYYPNVTTHHVYGVWRNVLGCSPEVAKLLTKLTTCAFHLPQGAPTSPALANLFLGAIYGPVLALASAKDITVTVWVDDLTFSGSSARQIMEIVRQTLAANGLKDSRKKRVILGPRDTKLITGVRLGKDGPRACRIKMREIRAGITNLSLGKLTEQGRERDIQSLTGKIAHIRSLCAADAVRLDTQLKNAVSRQPI
jgi:RNA-directed DNA polymerase